VKTGLFLVIGLIMLTSVCDTISQICLKTTINSLGEFSSRHLKNVLRFILKLILKPKTWLALIFSTLSLIICLIVLSKADLNFAFSVDSMHYIFRLSRWMRHSTRTMPTDMVSRLWARCWGR
jgi:hypothetical protein